jgi:lipoprotein-anchoring transpeptidase ErfK/SrfK
MRHLSRRNALLGAVCGALFAASQSAFAQQPYRPPSRRYSPQRDPYGHDFYGMDDPDELLEPYPQPPLRRVPAPTADRALYGPVMGEPFPVPALNLAVVNPAFLRRRVAYAGGEDGGTIVVDPAAHYLYFVLGDGSAIRYGVGVGRTGFSWSGSAYIRDKREWPDWYPPKEMLGRQPELRARMQQLQSGIGMPGGPGNPLGARALYLWQGNKDTLYRLHGTVEPWTIGKSVSSGCIRMINQDVIDLYERVQPGAAVIVLGARRLRRAPDRQADWGGGGFR